MEENHIIQKVLDIIENRITETITLQELAKECGYSTFHLNRIFSKVTKLTLMAYTTRRKLRYAFYDISCGEKIIDVAMKYGFETHAGFTKSFKKIFGYPPSLYRIHAVCNQPTRMELTELLNITSGGIIMNLAIVEIKPFTVVGFATQHMMPDVRFAHDVPAYWAMINMAYAEPLTRLHNLFNKSRHTEYAVCFDVDPLTSKFSYLLGVGVDSAKELSKVESDMNMMKMPGGLYAKFTTPLVEESQYVQSIRDAWKNIFDSWLPTSGYLFDEKRYDFEYYDERDHQKSSMHQMDIYIPIQKR